MNEGESNPIGLIAGEGAFPVMVARGARAAGRRVVCASLGGFAMPELASHVEVNQPVGLMRIGQWVRVLKSNGVREAIMVGRVPKQTLYARGRFARWLQFVPDLRTILLYVRRIRHDKRDHALLEAVADELARSGITLIDSTTFVKDHLAGEGVMTKRSPSDSQRTDAAAGFELCKLLSQRDVGQSLALIDRDVIAVEAMEGTDRMIARAGELCRTRGWTFVKVGNVKHDMRFDVPTVGDRTIESLAKAGCGLIVLEADRVMMLEKPKLIELADRLGIAILGMAAQTGDSKPDRSFERRPSAIDL